LHPRSSHGIPKELRVEARRQGAIDGGGLAMRAQATRRDQEDCTHVGEGVSRSELSHLANPSKRRFLLPFEGRRASKARSRRIQSLRTMGIATTPTIVTLSRDETFTLFPTMCNLTTWKSSMPRSHNILLPLHMSTILNLLILDIPTYGLFSYHWV
jgi:hypothetical protein